MAARIVGRERDGERLAKVPAALERDRGRTGDLRDVVERQSGFPCCSRCRRHAKRDDGVAHEPQELGGRPDQNPTGRLHGDRNDFRAAREPRREQEGIYATTPEARVHAPIAVKANDLGDVGWRIDIAGERSVRDHDLAIGLQRDVVNIVTVRDKVIPYGRLAPVPNVESGEPSELYLKTVSTPGS